MPIFLLLFLLSFTLQILIPSNFPPVKILGFLPLITISILKLTKPKSAWISFFSGLGLDLLSMNTPLGFFALNYTLSTLFLQRYRKLFSEENLFSLGLLAYTFSFISTLIHIVLYTFIDLHLKASIFTYLTDLLLMPFIDTLYAFIFGIIPFKLYLFALEKKLFKLFKLKIRWAIYELSRITR
jgi:hypothetical protein